MRRITLLVAGVLFAVSANNVFAGSQTASQSGGAATSAPQTQSSQNSTQATPSAGITNGTLPIEATLLAYKSLKIDALNISRTINAKAQSNTVIVGTTNDISAILQLRIVIGQGSLLKARMSALTSPLRAISIPIYSKPVAKPISVGAGFITGTDIATLIQTIGSITAVNENLSSAPGALNDTTLAQDVSSYSPGKYVYIPSIMAPGLLQASDLSNAQIGTMLASLESMRDAAISQSTVYTKALSDAQTVLTAETSSYSASDVAAANAFLAQSSTINSLITLIGAASSAIDVFEGSLFSGQSPSSATSNSAQNSNNSQQQNQQQAVNLPSANPTAPQQQQQNQQQQQGAPNTSSIASSSSGALLSQILYADFLLKNAAVESNSNLYFLAVHALESGGRQWTHSNLFAGSWISFSGGAVASYSLFDASGMLQCSGIAYAYRGPVDAKWVGPALSPDEGTYSDITGKCN